MGNTTIGSIINIYFQAVRVLAVNWFEAVYSSICKLSTISNQNYRLLTGYRAEITVVTSLSIAQVKRATMHIFTLPPRGCYVAMEVSVDDFVTRAINLHASILDRSIVHGTNTNDLSQLQKENMATLSWASIQSLLSSLWDRKSHNYIDKGNV